MRVLGVIVCLILVFVCVTTIITVVGDKANMKKALSFTPAQYDAQLVPGKDADGNWSFTCDRPFKVLQLTDIHIGAGWMSLKKDSMVLNAVAAMVTA